MRGVVVVHHGERSISLRCVQVGAYVLTQWVHTVDGVAAGLPREALQLIMQSLPLAQQSPSVLSLMCAVRALSGVPVQRQRLLFCGTELDPARDLYSSLASLGNLVIDIYV